MARPVAFDSQTARRVLKTVRVVEGASAQPVGSATHISPTGGLSNRGSWLGIVVAHDPEYTDERYDIASARVANTDSQQGRVTYEAFAAGTAYARTVVACNTAEAIDHSHNLAVGTPVFVYSLPDQTEGRMTRHVFTAGGAGAGGFAWCVVTEALGTAPVVSVREVKRYEGGYHAVGDPFPVYCQPGRTARDYSYFVVPSGAEWSASWIIFPCVKASGDWYAQWVLPLAMLPYPSGIFEPPDCLPTGAAGA